MSSGPKPSSLAPAGLSRPLELEVATRANRSTAHRSGDRQARPHHGSRQSPLWVFVVLLHHRRRVVLFNVTDSPTAAWTEQQVLEGFPNDSAPRYLLRDRDSVYRDEFRLRVKVIGIAEVLTAAGSPWQNAFVERVIGTVRRELLDHVIVLNERHLRRGLRRYFRFPVTQPQRRVRVLHVRNHARIPPMKPTGSRGFAETRLLEAGSATSSTSTMFFTQWCRFATRG
jgi:transposase InsO family protein